MITYLLRNKKASYYHNRLCFLKQINHNTYIIYIACEPGKKFCYT